ncbi:nucleoside hydrolase [Flagellimonas allohymeniacidonis]|uniref:Nucleoside hydrolase n=2 Tax=Flagellimonas allohymeniacidonis TaxID=2517819 RepID=A0A4Q8QLU4_9FLAO|nr:nucleoside hydrolase [Allomuricauda hymeniacidonis]
MMVCLAFSTSTIQAQEVRSVIVDADTGNEVDDFYALARIFMEPSVEITALNSAHWQTSHWAVPNSMENSHRLNQQLLGEMNLNLKTLRGATARMYDWGDRAQHSAATYEIIRQAKEKDELTILVLGALTNVASAIYLEPEIAKKLKVYWLGTTMDFANRVLKRDDFNPLMDPYALDVLLNSEAEMFIMPINVAVAMEIDFDELQAKTQDHFLGKFLLDRWTNHLDGSRKSRILWDLVLISAFIYPDFGTLTEVQTSRDNGNRKIKFYSEIDSEAIYQDFYETLLAFEKE